MRMLLENKNAVIYKGLKDSGAAKAKTADER
jgi:hypothetical protein